MVFLCAMFKKTLQSSTNDGKRKERLRRKLFAMVKPNFGSSTNDGKRKEWHEDKLVGFLFAMSKNILKPASV